MRPGFVDTLSYLIALAIVYPVALWLKHLGFFKAPIHFVYWRFG